MIVVTGAGGKTGQAVLAALAAKGVAATALVRRQEQVSLARELGAEDAAVVEMLDRAEMTAAMDGASGLYLIAPNMHPEETRIGEVAIAAARDAGVVRVGYHSVLHPQTRAMPHHWRKLAVEEKLFESDLDYTILQPAAYMQNVVGYWKSILEDGVYRVPYGPAAKLSLVDLWDVAEVAAHVLSSEGHSGATYELAGPEALSPDQIAGVCAQTLKRDVRFEQVPVERWVENPPTGGMDEYQLRSLVRMFEYYDKFGLRGNSRVLEWLLGRSSTTFREFVERLDGHQ